MPNIDKLTCKVIFLHQGLAEWNVPQGGMFLWIKCLGISDTRPMIMERALKKDVILLPGREFMTDPSQPCPYMRASFSLPTPENIDRVFSKTLII
jgi:kynurenine/2-aminoadipate aminotransferase